ncbi:cupin domain-containing protein [Gordonia polyisoprenivorans]|uniref:cupin domain-containing protein n=1 Tax=Gordonia polyisoprenivorans TaxID=84595 RepID=UPI0003732AC3|nr:cupin domain-containing protein [Gordonia polyisoprenivorans]UZF54516.1 cupin domain-containing protein [Gordonia polyisoprenivorans]
MTKDQAALPEWAQPLGLAPHPEGGWYAETWRSELSLPAASLPGYDGDRAAGTAIYFVLLPGEESAWHTVRGAEMWLFHRGAPVELDLGGDGSVPLGVGPTGIEHTGIEHTETIVVGPDIGAGHRPQVLVPPGHWQRARAVGNEAALVSCVVVPGFDFADFRLA